MLDNNQSSHVNIDAPIPHHVYCPDCKTEMIAVNKFLSTPSYVCYNCGKTLVIETKEDEYKISRYSSQCYRVATKIIWGKIPIVIPETIMSGEKQPVEQNT